MDLKGKTAIVTGGAAGFGLGLVHELVNHGSNVVIFDLSAEALDSASDTIANGEERSL